MARIRSSGSIPEEQLYQAVRAALGHRRRIDRNVKAMPGCPDIVIPSLRLVIFATAASFMGAQGITRSPLSNTQYWTPKIAGNMARDMSVWRIWEHELTKSAFPETQITLQ